MTLVYDTLTARMSERDLQAAVIETAQWLGWRVGRTHWSVHSPSGEPDLRLVHPKQRRVLWVELKAEGGRLSAQQVRWLADLAAAGQETAIWRPTDWHDGTIERVLRGNHNPGPERKP